MDSSKTQINIIDSASILRRHKTARLDARPLGLGRQSLQGQGQAIRKAVEIISKSRTVTSPSKEQAAQLTIPKAEAILELVPDPGFGKLMLEMGFRSGGPTTGVGPRSDYGRARADWRSVRAGRLNA